MEGSDEGAGTIKPKGQDSKIKEEKGEEVLRMPNALYLRCQGGTVGTLME